MLKATWAMPLLIACWKTPAPARGPVRPCGRRRRRLGAHGVAPLSPAPVGALGTPAPAAAGVERLGCAARLPAEERVESTVYRGPRPTAGACGPGCTGRRAQAEHFIASD